MRALLCTAIGPLEKLTIREIPTPSPGPGQVLLDVKASSLNFPDVLMAQGLYQVKPPLPFSPGTEMSGVIVETSADVQGIKDETDDQPAGQGKGRHLAGNLIRSASRPAERELKGGRILARKGGHVSIRV